jgi:hypothetical protein
MDIDKCFEILSARQSASETEEALACPCRNQLAALECCQPIAGGAVAKNTKDLGDRSAIELVDDFLRLQQERVQVVSFIVSLSLSLSLSLLPPLYLSSRTSLVSLSYLIHES